MNSHRRRVIVRGDVQGVFFRDSCHQAAIAAAVTGWVSNRSDGSVEAIFEGEQGAVEAMCAWCREGPAHARVDDLEITEEPVRGESGFQVR